ncbi:MAG: hypothetical protein AAB019_08225 [Planctomycetota bacterium]
MTLNKKQLNQARLIAQKVFKAKEKSRTLWAKEPIKRKIQELIRMQEIAKTLHPEYSKILPWRIKTG